MDILITPQEGAPFDNLPAHTLSRLLLALERCKFLTDHLSLPTGHKAFVQSSALEQIRHVQAHTDGSGGSGGGSSSTKSGSRASRAGSVHSSKSRVSQFLNSPPRTTNTQDHQHEPQQDFVSPTRRSFGLTQLADIPEASSECDNEDEQFLSDEDGDLPSGSEASGAESGREQLSGAEDGDRDVGGEGYGTQSDMEAAGGGDGEGGDDAQAVKYDTYGGKRKKTTHRLYFGSRSSYMGVCQVPHPGALHRRIDIKVIFFIWLKL